MRASGKCLVAFAGLMLAAPWASASVLVASPGSGTTRTGDGFTLGLSFTVGSSNVSVTALEVWDSDQDGLQQSLPIAIWDSSGTKIASAIADVNTTDPLDGEFREKSITPVTLNAGQKYYLGVYYPTGDNGFRADLLHDHSTTPTMSNDFTGYAGVYSTSNTAGMITEPTNAVTGEYIGPNFQYTIVPEPSCLCLAAGGLAAFSCRRRTRRQ